MSDRKNKEIFNTSPHDPRFLQAVCDQLISDDFETEKLLATLIDISGIQDSFRFKTLSRARKASALLISDNLDPIALETFIESGGFPFYANGIHDDLINAHFLKILKELREKKFIRLINQFKTPLCHPYAEKVVRETLGLSPSSPLSDTHIKRAVLCAALTSLRQNVGSCFATAPAILIQKEQLESFLNDLYQLLFTGKLKRIFGGVEYAVPLSPSTGVGDLKKNLKSAGGAPWFSPGLIAALEALHVVDPNAAFEKKAEVAQELVQRHSNPSLTVDVFLQDLLRAELGISSEQVAKVYQLEKKQLKKEKMQFGARDFSLEGALSKVQVFKERYALAEAAFNGICENALLKSWEFTLASFSEVKMEFSLWNLYSSLGLSHQENNGIGQVIYRQVQERIDRENHVIEKYQKEYETAFDQARSVEVLFNNAGSEAEARRLKAEYQSRAYHMRISQELRDKAHQLGAQIADLYPFLLKEYEKKFPEYFQEVYDAKMQDYSGKEYDDSPAGFRLVYKHGRSDPSLWTLIYNEEQYIDALVDFFVSTEAQIAAEVEWEGGRDEIAALTSSVVLFVRSDAFLESAIRRMSQAHASYSGAKKPWAYISGGTMTTLLKTYYYRQTEFSAEERWVESPSELLIFLIDALKHLSHTITKPYLKDPDRGMLMSSPTHAFILLPGLEKFRQGWQDDIFTYSWVRDQIFQPSLVFYAQMRLNQEEQTYLVDQFSDTLPPAMSHALQRQFTPSKKEISIAAFRNLVLKSAEQIASKLDAFLYQALPLIPGKGWKESVRKLLGVLCDGQTEAVLAAFGDEPSPIFSAKQIKEIAKGCYLLAQNTLHVRVDLHAWVAEQARKWGLAAPSSLLVADTNWTYYFFGFVVNPGTERLELWRLDRTLSEGVPMIEWGRWLDGSEKKPWIIYNRPQEYTS